VYYNDFMGCFVEISNSDIRPAGYLFLVKRFNLNVIPHPHSSYVSKSTVHRSEVQGEIVKDIYPDSYWPGETTGNHLEFALKYDGVNLAYLTLLFNASTEIEIVEFIQSKPNGKYARRIWFFYEFLTAKVLPLKNLTKGNYTEILDSDKYFTIVPGERVQRQRIINNLYGSRDFCPVVRRTEKLQKMDIAVLRKRCEDIITSYSPELVRRALSYFYNRETKSSFEIEHVKPDASRTRKFVASLEMAEYQDFCKKYLLIDLQNRIVDPRFREDDYRITQNYVGQSVSFQKEIIHYICPKTEDLSDLMKGLLDSHLKMKAAKVSPIIHAAVIAYGFVFLHPFEDGNGRIHRFLIHNILSVQGMVPKGLMFPVSAVMLKNPASYNDSLEVFSRPLMGLIEYSLDETGQMSVYNDTSCWYRFMDMTAQTEALFDFVVLTIENELVDELNFLAGYENTKKAILEIIDMPDRLLDLFIRLCLQNNGSLSVKKKAVYFEFLNDDEVSSMEDAVREGFRGVVVK